MLSSSFVSKHIRRPVVRKQSHTGMVEWMKIGFLGSITLVLLMMFLFLTSTTSTSGHALNKALKSLEDTTQKYSYAKYEIAGENGIFLEDSIKIPTSNLGYQKNIVAVSDTSNFALKQ